MDVRLKVHVSPGSRRGEILGYDEWRNALMVRVKSPPEGGKANREVVKLLSEFFSADVEIVSGHRSRSKVVVVKGLSEKEVYDRAKGL